MDDLRRFLARLGGGGNQGRKVFYPFFMERGDFGRGVKIFSCSEESSSFFYKKNTKAATCSIS